MESCGRSVSTSGSMRCIHVTIFMNAIALAQTMHRTVLPLPYLMHSTRYSYSEARIGLHGKFLVYNLLVRGYPQLADVLANILEVHGVLHDTCREANTTSVQERADRATQHTAYIQR